MAKSSSAKRRAVPTGGRPPSPPPPEPKQGVPLWVTLAIVAFLLAVGITILVVSRSGGGDVATGGDLVARMTATGGTLDERSDPDAPRHVPTPPSYTVDPPAGGPHVDAAAGPQVYEERAVPPDATVVHAMEHGYVVLWYRPDLRGDDLAALRAVFDAYPRDLLLVPRAGLPATTPVVATAWHHRLLLPTVAKDPLLAFTERYRNQGPERIPH